MRDTIRDQMTTEEALALFDSLDPVPLAMMMGKWTGSEIRTGHPMDGVLEVSRWHGKEFRSPDEVFPLVHRGFGGRRFSVNPALMPIGLVLGLPVLRNRLSTLLFLLAAPLISTRKGKARLRMTSCRGKTSATMIYDAKPIHDIFRKIDDDSVLGLMDLKGVPQPYFFMLRRES